MNEWIKNNLWSIFVVLFLAGGVYFQIQGVSHDEDALSDDVHVVNQSIAQLNTDVKVLDTRTTRDEVDIQHLQEKLNK